LDDAQVSAEFKNRRRILLVALLLFFAITFGGIFNPDELRIIPETQEKLGFLACLLVFILFGVTHITTNAVALLTIARKRSITAIILTGLRNTIADFIEYCGGGSIVDLTDIENKRERLPFHLGQLPYNSPAFLFFAHLVPIIGPCSRILPEGCPKCHSLGTYQPPLPRICWVPRFFLLADLD
jgi:hypothetical protein